jgi:hypothetical protein
MALEVNGEIERAQRERIDRLTSLQAAQELAKTLGADVAAAASAKWRQAGQQVVDRCRKLLGPLLEATEGLSTLPGPEISSPALPAGYTLKTQDDWWARLFRGHRSAMTGFAVGGSAGSIVATVLAAHLVAPVAFLGAVVAGIFGLLRGFKAATQRQLQAAGTELHKHLAETLHRLRVHFLDADKQRGPSPVDQYFADLEQTIPESIQETVTRKLAESRAQIARLREEARLDADQRRARLQQLEQQQAEWQSLGEAIGRNITELAEWDQAALSHTVS